MSRLRLGSVLLLVLLVASQIASVGVEAWSEVVYTKPWTEPEENEAKEDEPAAQGGGVSSNVAPPEVPPSPAVPEVPQNPQSPSEPEIDDVLLDFQSLYGTWYIWTPSTVVNIHAPGTGEYIAHKHVEGADQGMIVIGEDGSYTMTHAAWAKGETVSGNWRLSYPREINGEVLQAIVLVDGITNVDWAVAPSSNGKIRLLWAMGWADGSATWVFDSELVRP